MTVSSTLSLASGAIGHHDAVRPGPACVHTPSSATLVEQEPQTRDSMGESFPVCAPTAGVDCAAGDNGLGGWARGRCERRQER